MANTSLPANAIVLSALDPTYTLTDNAPSIATQLLPAYLRFHYLFLGPLVLPRTYLIHGRYNPFIELYLSGPAGQNEMNDLLTSGGAFVTGHDHPDFQRLQDHLAVTLEEKHPLVFDPETRLAVAADLNSQISPECVVTLPATKVTSDFQERFKREYLKFPAIQPDDWDRLDQFACQRLVERNEVNRVKYPKGKWGRNEICDFIARSAQPQEARILADCAVAAYQRVFAASNPDGARVVVRSSSSIDQAYLARSNRLPELPLILAVEPNHTRVWELDCGYFGSRPWKEIQGRYTDTDWQQHLTDFRRALGGFDRKAAESALTNLFEILRTKYPAKKSGVNATLNWIANNAFIQLVVDVVGGSTAPPLSWYIVGPHASLVVAAYLHNQVQQKQRRRNVRCHLNYLLKPTSDSEG